MVKNEGEIKQWCSIQSVSLFIFFYTQLHGLVQANRHTDLGTQPYLFRMLNHYMKPVQGKNTCGHAITLEDHRNGSSGVYAPEEPYRKRPVFSRALCLLFSGFSYSHLLLSRAWYGRESGIDQGQPFMKPS